MPYTYTDEELEAQAEADNYIRDLDQRKKRAAKLRRRAEKLNLTPVTAIDHTNIDGEFRFVCDRGHEVLHTEQQLLRRYIRYGCPKCKQMAMISPRASAVFRMWADEQGFDVAEYHGTARQCILVDRFTGDRVSGVWPQNIERWSLRPGPTRFVAAKLMPDGSLAGGEAADEPGALVFVFKGEPPIVKRPIVAEMLKRFEIMEAFNPKTRVRTLIDQFLEEGDHVINYTANWSWIVEPDGNMYQWGELKYG